MPVSLIGGPYGPPKYRIGQQIDDQRKGPVAVAGDWPTAIGLWPMVAGPGAKNLPILCGSLITAVQTESVAAIMGVWRVSRDTVKRWRRALGVPRMTEGTTWLYRRLVGRKLPLRSRRKGGRARAKMFAAK